MLQPARHSKLEKADILEMTVKHLQTVQRQQLAVAVATDPNVLHKFKTGFSECATEVSRYIGHLDGVDPAVRQRLLAHLSQCVNGLQQLTPFSFMGSSPPAPAAPSTFPTPQALPAPNPIPQVPFPAGDVNNNHTRLMGSGLQLIPSRLPSGELALVVPGNNNNNNNTGSQPFFPPSTSNIPSATVTSGAIDRSHPSAFTAVKRPSSPRPLMSPVSSSSEDSSSSYPQSPPPVAFKAPAPIQEQRTHVKLELKTVAVASSSSSFPRLTSSIGTSTSPPPQSRHALDFSMKPPPPRKRPAESDERLQEPKVQRFSFHVSTHREQVLPRVSVPARLHPPACAGNDSMWRPW